MVGVMDILDARLVASATKADGLPPPMFAEVAIAGRSNVGKSSLLNHLARRQKLVRTSSTPGCTRSVNIFRLKLRGAEIDLVDLPGYGYAARSKAERSSWGPLIEGFLSTRVGLRAVVVLVDVRRGVEDDDRQLVEFLESLHLAVILVATKIDKLSISERQGRLSSMRKEYGVPVLGYSSAANLGREELWKALLDACSIVPEKAPVPAAKPAPSDAAASAGKNRARKVEKPVKGGAPAKGGKPTKGGAKPAKGGAKPATSSSARP